MIPHLADAAAHATVPREVVEAVRRSCADDDAGVRLQAIRAYVDMVDGKAGPELARALTDSCYVTSDCALDAFDVLGPKTVSATLHLVRLVRGDDEDLVSRAALALKFIGAPAREASADAVPALLAAVEKSRVYGPLGALASVAPDVAFPLLRDALMDGSVERRREAAEAARDMTLEDATIGWTRQLVRELAVALRADDKEAVQLALEALQMLGAEAAPAAAELRPLLASDDPWIRR